MEAIHLVRLCFAVSTTSLATQKCDIKMGFKNATIIYNQISLLKFDGISKIKVKQNIFCNNQYYTNK